MRSPSHRRFMGSSDSPNSAIRTSLKPSSSKRSVRDAALPTRHTTVDRARTRVATRPADRWRGCKDVTTSSRRAGEDRRCGWQSPHSTNRTQDGSAPTSDHGRNAFPLGTMRNIGLSECRPPGMSFDFGRSEPADEPGPAYPGLDAHDEPPHQARVTVTTVSASPAAADASTDNVSLITRSRCVSKASTTSAGPAITSTIRSLTSRSASRRAC